MGKNLVKTREKTNPNELKDEPKMTLPFQVDQHWLTLITRDLDKISFPMFNQLYWLLFKSEISGSEY